MTHQLRTITRSPQFIKRISQLYGSSCNTETQQHRYESLIETHLDYIKDKKIINSAIFSTSGRTELGGNHTDHNHGKVIAGSINLDTIAVASSIEEPIVTLISPGFPDVVVDISSLDCVKEEEGTTNSLVRGIAHAFHTRNLKVGGLIIHTSTNVLKGSGLSSSAAIEVLIGTIFNSMCNEEPLNPVELAIIGQYAENSYFGKPSGLMDQIACAVGNIVKIDFKESEKPIVSSIPIDFTEYGYQLMIIDTKGDHANLGEDYASIPREMKSVASFFNKSVLREITFDQFEKELPALRKALGNDRAILRAYHFLKENDRVDVMEKALLEHDIELYLDTVKDSGKSSFQYLQNIYSSNNPTVQSVAVALAMCEQLLERDGAARVHGGGFAGTVQVYVPLTLKELFTKRVEQVFGEGSVTELTIRPIPTCRVDKWD
jgi:galactokinase